MIAEVSANYGGPANEGHIDQELLSTHLSDSVISSKASLPIHDSQTIDVDNAGIDVRSTQLALVSHQIV